jgi:uncharacterized protein (DUF58 family)
VNPPATTPRYGGPPPILADVPAEQVLRRLELAVTRRLDGLLQGDYLGLLPGPGGEPGESREYRPGDDVRRMDWPVTARTTIPHVRETIADRELESWVLVDLSASLDFGTARCEKRDLAVAAVAAVSYLTAQGGNRVGAVVASGDGKITRLPARNGRLAARALLKRVIETPRAADATRGGRPAGPAGSTDLAGALESLRRPPRRRGMAVVVSDFLSDTDWPHPLRALGQRHEVLCVEIVDPRELELPSVGVLTLVDPETGAALEVQTGNRKLRERYARAAAEQRSRIARSIRQAGAGHLRLRTDGDWLLDVVRYVTARRRGATGGAVR